MSLCLSVNRIRLPNSSWSRAWRAVGLVRQVRRSSAGSWPVSVVEITRNSQRGRRIWAISASTLSRLLRVLPRARRAATSRSCRRALARGLPISLPDRATGHSGRASPPPPRAGHRTSPGLMVLEDAHTFQLARPSIVEGKAARDRNAFGEHLGRHTPVLATPIRTEKRGATGDCRPARRDLSGGLVGS